MCCAQTRSWRLKGLVVLKKRTNSPLCQTDKTKWEPLNVVSKLEGGKDKNTGNQRDSLLPPSSKVKRLTIAIYRTKKALVLNMHVFDTVVTILEIRLHTVNKILSSSLHDRPDGGTRSGGCRRS